MPAPGYEDAVRLYRSGQVYSCLEACEKILAAHPDDPETMHLVGMLCFRAGHADAAADWFRRCLKVAPEFAEAHIDLALTLKKQGRLEDAVATYKRGLALDPANPQAHFNSGVAQRQLGLAADAAKSFRTAVEQNPFLPDGYNALGLAEAEAGNDAAAADAFRKAIAIAPDIKAPFLNLATLGRRTGKWDLALEALRWGVSIHGNKAMGVPLAQAQEDSGHPHDALATLEATIAEAPDSADAWDALAGLHFRQHRFDESLTALRRCVDLDPARAEVHMRIHTMAQIVGQRDLALEHQRRALAVKRLFTETGADPMRPALLVLKAAGDWQANLPTDFILRRDDWSALHHYFVSPDEPPPLEDLPPVDIVFNAVAEPDLTRPELAAAASVASALKLPVINDPDRVRATGRADIAAALAGLAQCVIPASIRLPAQGARAALEAALKDERIAPPLLLRPVGTHAGQGMILAEDQAALDAALASLAGGEIYVTHFVDYKNHDGLYRKYRVIVVDGRPYPFHMAISKRWLVHYYNAVNDDPAMMDREEEHFLADLGSVFSAPMREAFAEMARRLKLDFFGVDCSIAPDGRLLLFELDVGVIVHVMDDPVRHPYKHRYVPRIFEAVKKMIESRAFAALAAASH